MLPGFALRFARRYGYACLAVIQGWSCTSGSSPTGTKDSSLQDVQPHMSSMCVLMVEDFAPFRQFVRSTLAGRHDVQIIGEVADGLEAVQKTETLEPDLVLLDIGLPTLNGMEAARVTPRTPQPHANTTSSGKGRSARQRWIPLRLMCELCARNSTRSRPSGRSEVNFD